MLRALDWPCWRSLWLLKMEWLAPNQPNVHSLQLEKCIAKILNTYDGDNDEMDNAKKGKGRWRKKNPYFYGLLPYPGGGGGVGGGYGKRP